MAARNRVAGLCLLIPFLSMQACSKMPSFWSSPEATSTSPPISTLESTVTSAEIAEQYPKVDGSTSAHPLQVLIACEILDVNCTWTEPLFTEKTIQPDIDQASEDALETIFNIWHSGTHEAYMRLIEEETDFILVARLPSNDEKRAANRRKVSLDIRVVALDAFIFLVHKENPIVSLTLKQIREIYTGKVTDWEQLGGIASPIHAYQRNPNSGSQELMDDLVMRGRKMINAPDMIFESMMGPINAIRDDPQGIGYSVYYYASFMLPDDNIRFLGIEGVAPTSETIASSAYPLVTEVYAIVRTDMPKNSPAVNLRDWLCTPAGQAVVERSGYVPISQ